MMQQLLIDYELVIPAWLTFIY